MHCKKRVPPEVLSVEYFDVVVALPAFITDVAYQNKAAIYDILPPIDNHHFSISAFW